MSESMETLLLGMMHSPTSSSVWQKSVSVNGQQIMFKLDMGAAMTAIPKQMYSKKLHGRLSTPNTVWTRQCSHRSRRTLYCRKGICWEIAGICYARFSYSTAWFPAIQDLCLISPAMSEITYMKQYPRVFTGLGKLEGEYKIKLKENATPFSLTVPCHMPLGLKV